MTKQIFLPIIAVIAAVVLAFGTGDFASQDAENKNLVEHYYLKAGMNTEDALNASNYQSSLPSGITCDGIEEVPCHYQFTPSVSFPTFQDFLNTKDKVSVVAEANQTRSQ